jgi:menaquinone-dependent protoporphyrinogen oxidase
MPKIAIVYKSVEGQTHEVAERIAAALKSAGDTVEVAGAEAPLPALRQFDGVIVGGSVHAGKHHGALGSWVREHLQDLRAMPTAFFSVSMTATYRDDEHQQRAKDQASSFLRGMEWEPNEVAIFAGALKYTKYNFLTRRLMRWIARREGGETDTSRDWVYTDWAAVDRFARDVHERVASRSAALAH